MLILKLIAAGIGLMVAGGFIFRWWLNTLPEAERLAVMQEIGGDTESAERIHPRPYNSGHH